MAHFTIQDGILMKYIREGSEKEVVIPKGVTFIADGAFFLSREISSVTLPYGVTKIGKGAFRLCFNLKHITIPDSIQEIDDFAFYGCSALKSVQISSSVLRIGADAFHGCENLKSVQLREGLVSIGKCAFEGCEKLEDIAIPQSVMSIGDGAFVGCTGLARDGWIIVNGCVYGHIKGGPKAMPEDIQSVDPKYLRTDYNENVIPPVHIFKTQKPLPAGYAELLNLQKAWDAEVLAYVVMFQKGNSWRYAWGNKANLGKYGEPALKLMLQFVAELGKLSKAQQDRLFDFILTAAAHISDETLQKAVALLKDKKIKADELVKDGRIASRLPSETEEKTGKAEPENPVEAYVAKNWRLDDTIRTVQKVVRNGVKFAGSTEKCSKDVLVFLITSYLAQCETMWLPSPSDYKTEFCAYNVSEKADWIAGALDREELSAVLEEIAYDKSSDYLAGIGRATFRECTGYFLSFCRYANEKQIAELLAKMNRWKDKSFYGSAGRRCVIAARSGLFLSDARTAALHFDSIGALSQYARRRGMDVETMRDITLTDFGLDQQGQKEYDLGGTTLRVSLQEDLTFRLFDVGRNKVVKSIPTRGLDEAKVAAANEDYSDLKKNLKKVAKGRCDSLLEKFLSGESRDGGTWKRVYLGNALLHQIASIIVWQQDGKTFTLRGGAAICSDETAYTVTDAPIQVAHPIEMTAQDITAWQKYFVKCGLKQPFAQIWESALEPKDIAKDRYAGCRVSVFAFKDREKHGIYLSGVDQFSLADCRLEHRCEGNVRHVLGGSFVLGEFSFQRYTRKVNHIVSLLDRWTVSSRIAKDDTSIAPLLETCSLPQLESYMKTAMESNSVNCMALLLDCKNRRFADFDPMDEFTLDE